MSLAAAIDYLESAFGYNAKSVQGTLTVNGAFSLLFKTTVLPAARAAATFIENIISGKFHGIIMAATPYGSLTVILSRPGVLVLAVPCTDQAPSAKDLHSSEETLPSTY